jgi:histidinol-phosphate aminotransferase
MKRAETGHPIADWIRPEILQLTAYNVADAGNLIKLDAMENPWSWPEEMVAEWQQRLASVAINRYPDPAARQLVSELRQTMAIPDDMAVMLGNGSDEIIQIVTQAMGGGGTILAPEPGFVMYRQIAISCGRPWVSVALASDFSLDREAMLAAIAQYRPAVVWLAYPNNPTGNLFDDAVIAEIIRATPGIVIIDEAYHAFAGCSWMDRCGEFDNLLVMRTLSKLGLAGLRLGFLVGPAAWIDQFDKIRLPYNINILSQVTTTFALQHLPILTAQTRLICQERERVYQALQQMVHIQPYPSAANFILLRTPDGKALPLFEAIKARGVLIKRMSLPGLSDTLRVTIGKPEENDAFLHALRQALAELLP